MPQSIPAGLTRDHVLKTLAEIDAGIDHPFGVPTVYELVHENKRYAPKAVVGLSCRYSRGKLLSPEDFSGGESPGQANYVLRKLGFTVVKKEDAEQEPMPGKDWTKNEVRLIVADYFSMLNAEILGMPYKKSEHRRLLIPSLGDRSDGSVEFKHSNVSGVLVDMGLPYIEGYKPRSNYQNILFNEVEAFLDQRPDFLEQWAIAPALNPTQAVRAASWNPDEIIVAPPEITHQSLPTQKPWLSRKGRRIDFAERDLRNRQTGEIGEKFVFYLEQYRLKQAGRDDLAQKVVWASKDMGDGLGFDILSHDEMDDSEQMLEVKTTGLGKLSPFYVTSNEVRCSENIPSQFKLFRVFDITRSAKLYILHGSLREKCHLDPVLYRAMV